MRNPYDETYDRRRLASVPHVIEVRDRSLKDVRDGGGDGTEVRYNNLLEASYLACHTMGCWFALVRRAGFTEQGVDVFIAPVPIGQGRFVSVAPIKGDGPHVCAHCGTAVTLP